MGCPLHRHTQIIIPGVRDFKMLWYLVSRGDENNWASRLRKGGSNFLGEEFFI